MTKQKPVAAGAATGNSCGAPSLKAQKSIEDVPAAVEAALAVPDDPDPVFRLARAARGLEMSFSCPVSPAMIDDVFRQWWTAAKSRRVLSTTAEYDILRLQFLAARERVKTPLGYDAFTVALAKAQNHQPEAAKPYSSPGIRLLVAVCYHLATASPDGVFSLGCRQAAKVIGVDSHVTGAQQLAGLCADRVLSLVRPGGTRAGKRMASEYRYVAEDARRLGPRVPPATSKSNSL